MKKRNSYKQDFGEIDAGMPSFQRFDSMMSTQSRGRGRGRGNKSVARALPQDHQISQAFSGNYDDMFAKGGRPPIPLSRNASRIVGSTAKPLVPEWGVPNNFDDIYATNPPMKKGGLSLFKTNSTIGGRKPKQPSTTFGMRKNISQFTVPGQDFQHMDGGAFMDANQFQYQNPNFNNFGSPPPPYQMQGYYNQQELAPYFQEDPQEGAFGGFENQMNPINNYPPPIAVNKRKSKILDKANAKVNAANLLSLPDNIEQRDQDESSNVSGVFAGDKKTKRRGKKRERDDVYFVKGNKKIEDIQNRLKNENMNVEERQKLRNQISAQKSRLKKKEETIFMNKEVRAKDAKYTTLVRGVCQIFNQDQGEKLMTILRKEWDVKKKAGQQKGSVSLFNFMSENFVTKQEELDQFQQNDEKEYEEDQY